MMTNLIYKEFKLSAHPTIYIFLSFALMLLIPSYPYYVPLFYTCLSFFFMFISGRENKDILYTVTLPIRKSDAVKARCLFIAFIELAEVLLCALVAVIRAVILPDVVNAAGIDANPAFFGLALIMLALFNTIFIPAFYKTAYKAGVPFAISCIAMAIYIAAAESLVWIPSPVRTYLDTTDPVIMVKQLPVLIAGMIIWVIATCAAYKKGAKNFEKVDI